MKNLTINNKNRTIEMSKKFAKEASRYGSEAYEALQGARRDYPNYIVTTVKPRSRKDTFKGLTYERMEMYIKLHDNAEKNLQEFNDKRYGIIEHSYGEIKKWFLEMYPEVAGA